MVGHKIKMLAEILRVLGIIISVIIGLYFFNSNLAFGIIYIVVGCVVTFISSLCLYGFGELIVETTANRDTNDRILEILESKYAKEQDHEPTHE